MARDFSEISQGDLDFLVPFYCLAYPTKDKRGNNLRVALGNNGGRGYNPRRGSEYIIDSRAKMAKRMVGVMIIILLMVMVLNLTSMKLIQLMTSIMILL